jgi:hypothetical protein
MWLILFILCFISISIFCNLRANFTLLKIMLILVKYKYSSLKLIYIKKELGFRTSSKK